MRCAGRVETHSSQLIWLTHFVVKLWACRKILKLFPSIRGAAFFEKRCCSQRTVHLFSSVWRKLEENWVSGKRSMTNNFSSMQWIKVFLDLKKKWKLLTRPVSAWRKSSHHALVKGKTRLWFYLFLPSTTSSGFLLLLCEKGEKCLICNHDAWLRLRGIQCIQTLFKIAFIWSRLVFNRVLSS